MSVFSDIAQVFRDGGILVVTRADDVGGLPPELPWPDVLVRTTIHQGGDVVNVVQRDLVSIESLRPYLPRIAEQHGASVRKAIPGFGAWRKYLERFSSVMGDISLVTGMLEQVRSESFPDESMIAYLLGGAGFYLLKYLVRWFIRLQIRRAFEEAREVAEQPDPESYAHEPGMN